MIFNLTEVYVVVIRTENINSEISYNSYVFDEESAADRYIAGLNHTYQRYWKFQRPISTHNDLDGLWYES